MNKNFAELQPKAIWTHFLNICQIPHPSHHEDAIAQYIVDFAKANGIECQEDSVGNVILRKGATPGMESAKGIVLQAHLDMVPQKNSDTLFDFQKDAIEAYIDGEWVTANKTTLGADNGIGIAAILAFFEDNTLPHGPIEALVTRTEETGMIGSFGLKQGLLSSEILLNLDSEREGELCVGCAGGLDANISIKYSEVTPDAGKKALLVEVNGLSGGHSGVDIALQRANANKLLCRLLRELEAVADLHLAAIDGGGLRNAIPSEAKATILVAAADVDKIKAYTTQYLKTIITDFEGIEQNISLTVSESQLPQKAIDKCTGHKLIAAIFSAPNGVIKMSVSIPGLVETSSNLARVVAKDGEIFIQCLVRSSSRSEKYELGEMIRCTFELAGASVELTGAYDGWNPNMNSPILKTMIEGYNTIFGEKPHYSAIHAGLECGIISGAYPKLDMISLGPTICWPHSPEERVEIASVAKFWRYLCYTLANAPKR